MHVPADKYAADSHQVAFCSERTPTALQAHTHPGKSTPAAAAFICCQIHAHTQTHVGVSTSTGTRYNINNNIHTWACRDKHVLSCFPPSRLYNKESAHTLSAVGLHTYFHMLCFGLHWDVTWALFILLPSVILQYSIGCLCLRVGVYLGSNHTAWCSS